MKGLIAKQFSLGRPEVPKPQEETKGKHPILFFSIFLCSSFSHIGGSFNSVLL